MLYTHQQIKYSNNYVEVVIKVKFLPKLPSISDFLNKCKHYLAYAWSFGSLLGIFWAICLLSGVLLVVMCNNPQINSAFSRIEHIIRDPRFCWLVSYLHVNSVSIFFMVVYAYMMRVSCYGSYWKPQSLLWPSGAVILFLTMVTAFTYHMLPWEQISSWCATVVTSKVTAIPVVGEFLVEWIIWGGGYITEIFTLKRLFALHHIMLPLSITFISFIHLVLSHKKSPKESVESSGGSWVGNLLGSIYIEVKDIFAFFCFLFVFAILFFSFPDIVIYLNDHTQAGPTHTPAYVAIPEWYFLPFFAILKAIPFKDLRILVEFGSVFILFLVPFSNTSGTRNTTYIPVFKSCFWFFMLDFFF